MCTSILLDPVHNKYTYVGSNCKSEKHVDGICVYSDGTVRQAHRLQEEPRLTKQMAGLTLACFFDVLCMYDLCVLNLGIVALFLSCYARVYSLGK